MKLSVAKVDVTGLDPGTQRVVSYDRCEKRDAYLGQINMLTASSFCGLNGALWGYDVAYADCIIDGTLKPMFTYPGPQYSPEEKLPKQDKVPVYPVAPLLDAAERLFGRMDRDGSQQIDRRRFPIMPGAHIICANKYASQRGPAYIWAAIAVAIAEDRNQNANVFIEDAAATTPNICLTTGVERMSTPAEIEAELYQSLLAVAKSIILCGQDQNVRFSKVFAGVKYIYVGPDEWGCALTCAPYVILAQDAISALKEPSALLEMTISQWEKAAALAPLPPVPLFPPAAGGVGVILNGDHAVK